MFIETHCHLEMIVDREGLSTPEKEIFGAEKRIVETAQKFGVKKIITIGTDLLSSKKAIAYATHLPPVFCSVGIHPCDATLEWRKDFESIKLLVKQTDHHLLVALGETGLDFYHPGFNKEHQKNLFRAHINLALEKNLPLIIHTRNSIDETLAVLQEYAPTYPRGVFHCFSEELTYAQKVVSLGFFLGIDGPITYPKNDALRTVVSTLGLKHLLLETDSPFLPPQEIRGKINYPLHVATIGRYIATLLNEKVETVASTTSANAERLFRLQKKTL